MNITIDRIKEGMQLSENISNKFGQLLLPANTRLEKKHIKLLKTWGIQSIQVQDEEDASCVWKEEKEFLIKAKAALEKRIKWKPRNPIEETIQEIALIKSIEKEN